MQQTAPTIYSINPPPARLSLYPRLLASSLAIGCLIVLVLAFMIPPSSDGFGTHTRLGLQPCQFLIRTGIPCPSCGMTTSFSWFMHGNLLASLWSQPMGCLLAFLTVLTFWAASYITLTGRPIYRLLRFFPSQYYIVPLLAMAILGWGWKIAIHLCNMDGWK